MSWLSLRSLVPDDAPLLAAWLARQPTGYLRYFQPFSFEKSSIAVMLRAVNRDFCMGFFDDDQPIALVLVRGWDEGYDTPSFGVVVDYSYQGEGWGMAAIAVAKALASSRHAQTLMLKVHPANTSAWHLYERAGFLPRGDLIGEDIVYEVKL